MIFELQVYLQQVTSAPIWYTRTPI